MFRLVSQLLFDILSYPLYDVISFIFECSELADLCKEKPSSGTPMSFHRREDQSLGWPEATLWLSPNLVNITVERPVENKHCGSPSEVWGYMSGLYSRWLSGEPLCQPPSWCRALSAAKTITLILSPPTKTLSDYLCGDGNLIHSCLSNCTASSYSAALLCSI